MRRIDHRQTVQPRVDRQRQHKAFVAQLHSLDALGQGQRATDIAQVEAPFKDHVRQAGHGAFPHIEADIRVLGGKSLHLFLQQPRIHRRRNITQFDVADIATPGTLGVLLGVFELPHRRLGFDQQGSPGFGQADFTRLAHEQARAEFVFHVLDLPSQGRRCDAELFGGASEVALPGNSEEIAEMTDVHRCISSKVMK
ncbi:hypothetical protein D3C73_1085070 [compost metagenome]